MRPLVLQNPVNRRRWRCSRTGHVQGDAQELVLSWKTKFLSINDRGLQRSGWTKVNKQVCSSLFNDLFIFPTTNSGDVGKFQPSLSTKAPSSGCLRTSQIHLQMWNTHLQQSLDCGIIQAEVESFKHYDILVGTHNPVHKNHSQSENQNVSTVATFQRLQRKQELNRLCMTDKAHKSIKTPSKNLIEAFSVCYFINSAGLRAISLSQRF